ncbi:MAG: hypothetical protein F4Y98_05165 [Chloroflexi bacterium]|nr:hypothetical protein [Chloroflexota bacterium]
MTAISTRGLLIALIATAVGLGALASAQPYGSGEPNTTPIELRVWQSLDDPTDIAIGARAPGGAWGELGMVRLRLDDGFTAGGHYRYGQTALEVPLTDFAPVGVEVRVWQAINVPHVVYVSARGVVGSWDLLGTFRFRLEHGERPDLGYRFGDMRIEVELPEPQVITLAGSAGERGYVDGVGRDARFRSTPPGAMGLDVDAEGNVIVADYSNDAIRRIARDGTVTTIAGGNGSGLRDGPADVAQFAGPTDVAVAADGTIYVAQARNDHIRKITPDGVVTTVAGNGSLEVNLDPARARDGPAGEAIFFQMKAIALGPDGDLYILENSRIRRLSPSGWVSTVAGGPRVGFVDGRGPSARFGSLTDIAVDARGALYVLESNIWVSGRADWYEIVRKIDANGVVRTLFRDPLPHAGGRLAYPEALTVGPGGDIYISNTAHNQIVRLTPAGEVHAVAGSGEVGSGDGQYGTAEFSRPGALALTPDGALIVADQEGATVRAILPGPDGLRTGAQLVDVEVLPRLEGVRVTRFAGRGSSLGGLRGDGGPADKAYFRGVRGIALDPAGNVLVADSDNHAVRLISTDGTISTFAGGNGKGVHDGPRDFAQFTWPHHVAVDAEGVIYVLEDAYRRVRRIAPDGTVSTLAGAQMTNIRSIATEPDGSLLFPRAGGILRRAPDGSISTLVAGSGAVSAIAVDGEGSVFYTVDEHFAGTLKVLSPTGEASTVLDAWSGTGRAQLSPSVTGIAIAPDGSVYLADPGFGRVLRLDRSGALAIVADRAFAGSQRGSPNSIVVTPEGDLLVSDAWQHVIWKITIDEDAGR